MGPMINILTGLTLLFSGYANAVVERKVFNAGSQYLAVEVLKDDLLHFEYAAEGKPSVPLYTSPMVAKTDYIGAKSTQVGPSFVETGALRADIHPTSLCVKITDKKRGVLLTEICSFDLNKPWKGLHLSKAQMENVYGLGQQFKTYGTADGDWVQHGSRTPGYDHGNGFIPFGKGVNGNAQFPIMYAVGPQHLNYALFLDNVYKQEWNFQNNPWRVQMWGDQLRFYVMGGADLLTLRQNYMELVGRPLVPPLKSMGLWVSEFGFENWNQVEQKKEGLRRGGFPVEGFVMDLQWFGGFEAESPNSRMGSLDWDRINFPNPESKIREFNQQGVGIITIEESYVARNLLSFSDLQSKEGLARSCSTKQPIIISAWFGESGMIDWSNQQAANEWHDSRRQKNLVDLGVSGHWTDLGEPERYEPLACYKGVESTHNERKDKHGDIHNLYNLLWVKSIFDGYVRNNVERRPFTLSRSGAPGVQRFGAAMWSGDIASDLNVLASHHNAQMHMSFSGIDFYGADIGGFHRGALPNSSYTDELYTQWFANATWFDVPVRPHTDNAFQCHKCYETSPDRVGRADSNLSNLRRRYELTPYYYSLAYRAHLFGEPLIPPPLFYHQDDQNLRQMGHEKMIGRDLLVGVVAKHGEYFRRMYLPRGRWINYYTNELIESRGEWTKDLPVYDGMNLILPAFVRAGAILPMSYVDDLTQNLMGQRADGGRRDELIVQVYPDTQGHEFTLFEDDGTSIAYRADHSPIYVHRTTKLAQKRSGDQISISIEPSKGSFKSAMVDRNNEIRLVVPLEQAKLVLFNGRPLVRLSHRQQLNAADSGWLNAGEGLVVVKSGRMKMSDSKQFSVQVEPASGTIRAYFTCQRGFTAPGENIFITGSIAQLGNWDTAKGVKLNPSVYYPNNSLQSPPVWTAMIDNLPAHSSVEWKCFKRTIGGQVEWQAGANNQLTTGASGYAGMTQGLL